MDWISEDAIWTIWNPLSQITRQHDHQIPLEDMKMKAWRFEDYHGEWYGKDGSTAVKEKGRVEHFGITLEKEEEGKYDATAQQDEEDVARIKCYICQRMGHFDTECPNEDQRPTNGASTSRQQDEEDTHSSSSEDFTIIV
ncbi:ARID DNA-binding domain-containing protein [Tanacetum coccineum]